MAAFRLYDKLQAWRGLTDQLLAGGYLLFYTAGTTTPQDVFGEKALTTNNGSQIALDASGRLVHDVWGDTADGYFVEVYDADDVKQGEADNVEVPGGAGQTIPVPNAGEYLTGDGTNFLTADLTGQLLPDQTGHSNEILGTDGSTPSWIAKPADGAAGTDGSDPITDGRIQSGTGTALASGAKVATCNIAFGTAYTSAPHVVVEMTGAPPTSSGAYPKHSVTAVSTTGFTVTFSTTTGGTSADNYDGSSLTGNTTFDWIAKGPVA